jgi:hypothetical protein
MHGPALGAHVEEEITQALAGVAKRIDADAVGKAIAAHVVRSVSDLAERKDSVIEEESAVAAASNVVAILDGLLNQRPADESEVPEATLKWAATLVHRGVPAAAIPRCYVAGQSMLDDYLRQVLADADLPFAAKWELAGTMSRWLFAYSEKVCGDVLEHYQNERDRWIRGGESTRTDLVLAMVEGRPFDAASATAKLRYDLNRPHVALMVWADSRRDEPPPDRALKAAAAQLARDLGGRELLVIPAGQWVLWAWTTGGQLSDGLGLQLSIDQALLAAVGGIGFGPAGFVQSHHEARDARQMARLLSRSSGSVVCYRSVALGSLLTRDPGAALRFVDAELHGLGADDDATRRLRATLAVFLEEGMSWARTARRLGLHQNTVMYRVKRAEELLGHPIAQRQLEIRAALRLADVRGALSARSAPASSSDARW